jgi:hypothetical protein
MLSSFYRNGINQRQRSKEHCKNKTQRNIFWETHVQEEVSYSPNCIGHDVLICVCVRDTNTFFLPPGINISTTAKYSHHTSLSECISETIRALRRAENSSSFTFLAALIGVVLVLVLVLVLLLEVLMLELLILDIVVVVAGVLVLSTRFVSA